jgi:predicted nucleic acid-binding protein
MIVVDSSTWADFFNGALTPHVERLDAALHEEEDLAILPIIITEVLQGFRAERSFQQAQRVLSALPVIEPTVDCHVRAARLFRSLRKAGITVRGAIDCIIAQTCLDLNVELLSPDGDFEHIARHTSLRLWHDASG